MQYEIFGKSFNGVKEMKAFCLESGIKVVGAKVAQDWQDAIEIYMETQSEVIAAAVDAAKEAEVAAETTRVQVEAVATAAVEVLTSDKAIAIYRTVFRAVVTAIVFAALMAIRVGRWCWANRHRTAVYHWIHAALDSRRARSVLARGLIGEWVLRQWIDAVAEWPDIVAQKWRDRAATLLARIGL